MDREPRTSFNKSFASEEESGTDMGSRSACHTIITAYDTETTGLRYCHDHEIFAWSRSSWDRQRPDEVSHVILRADRDEEYLPVLQTLWSDETQLKVMHNAKFDLAMTEKLLGRRLAEREDWECTLTALKVLRNDLPSYSLDDAAFMFCSYPRDTDEHISSYRRAGYTYDRIPAEIMDKYQQNDTERTLLLWIYLEPKLKEAGLWDTYRRERALIAPTLRMEQRGVFFRQEEAHNLIASLEQQCEELTTEVNQTFPSVSNLRSKDQLRKVIFEDLALPPQDWTPSGKPRLDKAFLAWARERHPHAALDALAEFNAYQQSIGTLRGYLKRLTPEGFLHSSINPNGADTGRESSTDPNLQNVERLGVLLNEFPVAMRTCFGPRPGYLNLHVDYAGQELRIAAAIAQDQALLDILNAGDDPHDAAAAVFYGSRWDNCVDRMERKAMRSAAKNGVYGIIYGANQKKLAATLGLSLAEGASAWERYRAAFPGIAALNKTTADQAKELGYVFTLFGRRLYVPFDRPYTAINYIIQGTGAELLKQSQIRVHAYLSATLAGEAGIVLPIHDELVMEFPCSMEGALSDHYTEIAHLMTDFPDSGVPLEVDAKISRETWAVCEKYKGVAA